MKFDTIIMCEESQAVTLAFRIKGKNAVSCDLEPCSGGYPEYHLQGDVYSYMDYASYIFGGAHPPCTYITNSGVRWLYNKDGSKNEQRWIELELAVNFFNHLKSEIERIGKGYLENPIPHKYARDGFKSVVTGKWVEGIGKYDQLIQPWQFGHGETKATCLWLVNLPPLKPTDIVDGREGKIWKMPPGPERTKLRSKTYKGIAKAMAEQWT